MFAHTQKQNCKTALSASLLAALLPKAMADQYRGLGKSVGKKGQKNVNHHFSYFWIELQTPFWPHASVSVLVCIQVMGWQMVCIRQNLSSRDASVGWFWDLGLRLLRMPS